MAVIDHLCNIAEHQHVHYIAKRQSDVRTILNRIEATGRASEIRYANGAEEARFPGGGQITFGCEGNPRSRGRTYQHVVLEDHRPLSNQRFLEEVEPGFTEPARYTIIG